MKPLGRLLAAGSLTLMTLAAPARAQTVITLWNGFAKGENEALVRMIEKYWAPTHPGIRVEVAGEKDRQAVLTAMSGGDAPDVVMSPDSESAALWFHNGALEDLTEFVKPFQAELEAKVVPAALAWNHTGPTWYALPFVDYNWALFYNKAMFRAAGLDPDRPPATIAELTDAAKKLTKIEGGAITQLGWMPVQDEWGAMALGLVFGARFVDAEGAPTMDDPALIRAMQWNADLTAAVGREKVAAFTSGFTHGDNPFKLGKVAMILDGSWQAVMLRDNKALEFGVAPMPAAEPGFARANNVGSNPIVIPRGGKHLAEAEAFAKFMALDPDLAAEFSDTIANLPHVRDRLLTFTQDPAVRMLARLSDDPRAVAWAPVPYARFYADALAAAASEMLARGTPAAEALKAGQATVAAEAQTYR